ncbi:MAG: hypothetical protein E6I44_13600 [Chloroflexi bacterium]|nr:MAG: hypothetical protein E6I44_13600 [Chloroflexota bacterium]
MRQLRRFVVATFASAALMVATAAVALADPGAPGSTFPEQPGTHPATACASVVSNPGTGVGGAAAHFSSTAQAITNGLVTDACFGG